MLRWVSHAAFICFMHTSIGRRLAVYLCFSLSFPSSHLSLALSLSISLYGNVESSPNPCCVSVKWCCFERATSLTWRLSLCDYCFWRFFSPVENTKFLHWRNWILNEFSHHRFHEHIPKLALRVSQLDIYSKKARGSLAHNTHTHTCHSTVKMMRREACTYQVDNCNTLFFA